MSELGGEGIKGGRGHRGIEACLILQVLEDSLCLFLPQLGRRMAEFPVDPMMSKMLIASEK